MTIINMQTMRYINLLDRISHVKTNRCFVYNNIIIFAVPRMMISRALGENLSNIKEIQERLGKRVRIIEEARGIESARKFIQDIVYPAKFKSLEMRDNELVITAGGKQNKAILLGRDKARFAELEQIVKDNFGLDLKII